MSAKCKTQHKTKVKSLELNSVGLSGSKSARQRFFGLLEIRDDELTQSLMEESVSEGKCKFRREV